MAISVVCPGCLKRFQVSDQFAGLKGPCPSCKTIIDIPKEKLVIHGVDDFLDPKAGKSGVGRPVFRPISRIGRDVTLTECIFVFAGFIAVLIAAWGFSVLQIDRVVANAFGSVGLLLLSFPLSLYGYRMLRDLEEIDVLSGSGLFQKTAICGAAYAVLWVIYESFGYYMHTDFVFRFVYLVPLIIFSLIAAHVILDFDFMRGLAHYSLFLIPMLLLRGAAGLGWLWIASEIISASSGGRVDAPAPKF